MWVVPAASWSTEPDAFIDQAASILFIGGPGVGKTHLAVALGLRAGHCRLDTASATH